MSREVKFSRVDFAGSVCYSVLIMKCDTCGKESAEVRRVIVDAGYDRVLAKPIYNCPDCYSKKELSKKKGPDSK